MADKTENTESFEVLLKRLEEIVHKMESGGLPLADAMTLYDEGIVMAGKLSAMIAVSREKVMKLVSDQDGGLKLEQFDQGKEGE